MEMNLREIDICVHGLALAMNSYKDGIRYLQDGKHT